MKGNSFDHIITYLQAHPHARAHDIVRALGISRVAVHRQLKKLTLQGTVQKAGKPPLVFYSLATSPVAIKSEAVRMPPEETAIIDEQFLSITPDGKFLYGIEGFIYWAKIYKPHEDVVVLSRQYGDMIREKKTHAPHGWVDATRKLRQTFADPLIDRLLFADTYSDPIFGRTKLAKLVMYAKQAQSVTLIHAIAIIIKPIIEQIIHTYAIDAVGFIPPTVPRSLQFMDELQASLALPIPYIDLVKVIPGDIPIPQKSLAKLDERILNAKTSIYLRRTSGILDKNLLLLDDVVGSGASFQETAAKLRVDKIKPQSITAFAIVGNSKGYEVIRQI